MIRYIYAAELSEHPTLAGAMFTDRAVQFRDRLGWDVEVDRLGWETDEYDRANPLYVIWEPERGVHGGSMRFLPTTGPTMLADHFTHLTDGVTLRSPRVWECTRFCVSPTVPSCDVARQLLLAAAELGVGMGLSQSVGVFDARMIKIYGRLGWLPEVLGSADGISAGLWNFGTEVRDDLAQRAGVSLAQSRAWFDRAFGPLPMFTR